MTPEQIRQHAAEVAEEWLLRAAQSEPLWDLAGGDQEAVRAELRVIAEAVARGRVAGREVASQ